MGGGSGSLAVGAQPEHLEFRLRWSEVQLLNRSRQSSASRWVGEARWRIYPVMLVLFGVYLWFSVGFGNGWLFGMLGVGAAVGVFLAFPRLFGIWAALPVLHWTIFDPISLLRRRTVDLDAVGMTVREGHAAAVFGWQEIDGSDRSSKGLLVRTGLRTWYLPARAFSSGDRFEQYSALIANAVNVQAAANVV